MFRTFMIVAVSAVFLSVAPPRAGAQTVTGSDVDVVMAIAQAYGTAELQPDADGGPVIRGRMEDVTYIILFYGCEAGQNCTNIQFGAAWEPGPPDLLEADSRRANEWNATKRYAKAFMEPDGGVIITMETNLHYGMERRNLEAVFDWWRAALQEFPRFFFQ